MKAGIRVDVDTLRDCEAVPMVLALLKKHRARATFFVTTGRDKAGLNAGTYLLRPRALLMRRPGRRYGYRNLLLSLLRPAKVEEALDFEGVVDGGHELALHGYEHVHWVRRFKLMGCEELAENIRAGITSFEEAAGHEPAGFASPGFTASDDFLMVLEGFGFSYSSDYMGCEPFYPVVNGRRLSTVQVPVSLDLEALAEKGAAALIKALRDARENMELTTMYFHPSLAYLRPGILDRALEELRGLRFLTYGEIADEDTPHI